MRINIRNYKISIISNGSAGRIKIAFDVGLLYPDGSLVDYVG